MAEVEALGDISLQTILTTPSTMMAQPDAGEGHEEFHSYPERGTKAWLVVFGAWCAMVPPLGIIDSMGLSMLGLAIISWKTIQHRR